MKIACYLPETVVTNEELASGQDGWTPEKIFAKTGIRARHVAAPGETSLDLAAAALREGRLASVCSAGNCHLLAVKPENSAE